MKASLSLGALACAHLALAEDALYSSRFNKRFVDDKGNYNMSFMHINDVHAHLDQYASSGTDCTNPSRGCYGGYARVKTTVDGLKKQHPDNLWLNAGDEFQGTLFYTYYGGEKIAETINELGFDAMTLGNHEWDGGDDKLGEFLLNLTFPIVSCNVKSQVPSLNKTIKNWHIFEKHQVAVIGVTTETTPSISHVGNTTKFLDPIPAVQEAIWQIRNTTNITRIVALTHIGYDVDQKLAAETEGLSLIIGGHSHTPLGDMAIAKGKYPTIVKDKSGHEVFIVTAYRWGEYLGYIDLTFGPDGKALAYHGGPIHMDNTTKPDAKLDAKIKGWRVPFEKFAAEKVGQTKNELDQTTCQTKDCLLGQVMADAMLEYRLNQTGDKADFALINAGGVRATIGAGDITRGEVLTSFPFGNAIVQLTYKGSALRTILEGCVSRMNQNNKKPTTSWFQVSRGLKVEYNPTAANGSRIVSVQVGGKALEDNKEYNMVTLDFLAGGGDNILLPTNEFITLDTQDTVLTTYIQKHSPLRNTLEQRVVQVNGTSGRNGTSGGNGTSSGNGTTGGSGGRGGGSEGSKGKSAASVARAPVLAAAVGLAVALMAL